MVVLDDVTPVGVAQSQSSWPFTWPTPIGSTAAGPTSNRPAIVDWKNTHPLLRYINLDNVQISETLGVKTPGWAMPLVEAQQTPLILAGELVAAKNRLDRLRHAAKHLAVAHFLSDVHRQRHGLAQSRPRPNPSN